jgi:hypothetical protein
VDWGVDPYDSRPPGRLFAGALRSLNAYGRFFNDSEETEARASKGEVLTSKDLYFVIAPTMQTSAKKCDWLNTVQCIGKMVSYKSDS